MSQISNQANNGEAVIPDLGTSLSVGALLYLLVLMFYDNIYPKQLTGRATAGNEVTLSVCPETPDGDLLFLEPGQPVEPALNPCFYYLSTSGFDRILSLARLFAFGRPAVEHSFCGTAGGVRYCYTFCTALRPGAAAPNPTDIVCIIYNNGYPPKPGLLPSDIDSIPLVYLPSDPRVKDDFFCGTVTSTTNSVRCIEPCQPQSPIATNPAPVFCYCEIFASFAETVTSKIYGLLEVFDRQVQDRRFCSFPSYSESGLDCSDSRRWCRPDRRGVYGLPPGETSCLMYLNGPAGAVGLLSATALGGITSLTTTLGGTVAVGGIGMSGAMAVGACPRPFFCTVGDRCCLIVGSPNGLMCPTSC